MKFFENRYQLIIASISSNISFFTEKKNTIFYLYILFMDDDGRVVSLLKSWVL